MIHVSEIDARLAKAVVDGMESEQELDMGTLYEGALWRTSPSRLDLADGPALPVFSPDSRRVAFPAKRGKERFLVVDGRQGKTYSEFIARNRIAFDTPATVHALAMRNNELFRFEETIAVDGR